MVVDTGAAGQSEKVLAAIKGIAPGKEIRWIINTTPTADHTGGNEQVSKAGRTVNGNQAAIVAHENANARMIERGVPDAARPYNTYFEAVARLPVQRRAGGPLPQRVVGERRRHRWCSSAART